MDSQLQKYLSANTLGFFVNQTCIATDNLPINLDNLKRDQIDGAVIGPVYASVKQGRKPKAALIKSCQER